MVSMQHHPNVTAHVHFCVGKGTTSAKIIYGNKQNNKKTNNICLPLQLQQDQTCSTCSRT